MFAERFDIGSLFLNDLSLASGVPDVSIEAFVLFVEPISEPLDGGHRDPVCPAGWDVLRVGANLEDLIEVLGRWAEVMDPTRLPGGLTPGVHREHPKPIEDIPGVHPLVLRPVVAVSGGEEARHL